MNGDLANARQALANGANPNAGMAHGDRALHIASSKGNVEMIRLLLDSKATLNAPCSPSYYTPLHVAAYYGQPRVVEVLLQAKADANSKLAGGDRPLEAAISAFSPLTARLDCLKLLIQANANVNNNGGTTALIRACIMGAVSNFSGQYDTVRFLLDAKADPNLASHGNTPMSMVGKSPDTVRLLLERGANANVSQEPDEVVGPSLDEIDRPVPTDAKRARTTSNAL
jgi:ankyrin repeat protein